MKIIKKDITEKILSILAVAGVLSIAIIAPNIIGIIGKSAYRKYKFDRRKYQKSLYYLRRKQYIEMFQEEDNDIIKLTKSGKVHAYRYFVDNLTIKEPKIWDGFLRIVAFDIPNILRFGRDALRDKLKKWGFYQLQESVFVYPYDCQKEIELLKEVYQLKPYVRFILVKSIDDQDKILKYFNLN
ncbi:MAG: hypothetical protein AB1465_06535 [Patescibacteria group bacterium]